MAKINEQGNILARCPDCEGALTTFLYLRDWTIDKEVTEFAGLRFIRYIFFKCNGCGRGAIGVFRMKPNNPNYPSGVGDFVDFYPESIERLKIPEKVPENIKREFREAENCIEAKYIKT